MSYGELSNTQETMVLPMLQMKNIRGKPYITVSAKGMVNGLSNIPNDGADFGPDTTLGATAPGQYGSPYTETVGIQEIITYVVNKKGGTIFVCAGVYNLTNSSVHTSSVSGVNPYIIGIPSVDASTELIPIKIIGELNTSTFMEALAPTDTKNDALIYCGNTTTTSTDLIQVIPNPSGSNYETGIHLILDNIHLRTHAAGYVNAVNCFYAISLDIGTISLDVDSTTGAPALGNQTGLICPQFGPGSQSYTTIGTITAMGYYTGISAGGNTSIGTYNIEYIFYGLSLDAPKYSVFVNYINLQNCAYAVRSTISSGSYINLVINCIVNGDQNGSPYEYDSSGYWGFVDDPNNTIYGYITAIPYATTSLPPAGPSWFIADPSKLRLSFIQNGIGSSIPKNPPVSGTTYQNTNAWNIRLKIPVTYSPTSSAAATLATGISTSSTVTTSTKVSIPAGATSGEILTYDMVVPAGNYFELVVTNATIGTVEVEADQAV